MEFHRMVLGVGVLGIIVATLFMGNPTITGFVPTETFSQKLDLYVFESQRFTLKGDGNLRLSTFALSGEVTGPDLVNVYLSDGVGRWLVYSNKKKPGTSMTQITGLATRELEVTPGERLDKIETLPPGYETRTGIFNNECVETCILDEDMFDQPSLYLDVIIGPGTTLHISEIIFSSMSE